MADGRGSGGSGGDQPFYNQDVKIGDQTFSVLTIMLVVGGGLFLTGSTALSGLFSVDGLMLGLYVGAIITAWKMRDKGIWNIVNQAIAFWIAFKLILLFAFSLAPKEYAAMDKQPLADMIGQIGITISSNSPLSNQPYDMPLQIPNAPLAPLLPNQVQTDVNVGGGVPTQNDNMVVHDTTPVPQATPTPNPVANEEVIMWNAYQDKDGQTALIAAETILSKVPSHIDAKRIQQNVLTDKGHADNLVNLAKVGEADSVIILPDRANPTQLNNAKLYLKGGTYVIVSIEAETLSGACNEPIYFQLTSGTYAGGVYETQRCIMDIVAGHSVKVGEEITIH